MLEVFPLAKMTKTEAKKRANRILLNAFKLLEGNHITTKEYETIRAWNLKVMRRLTS